jgi:RND family efflux transporter MFP subunit
MAKSVKSIVIPIVIIAGAVVLAGLMFASKKPPEKVVVEEKPILVDVIEVAKSDINFHVESQGTVRPKTQTTLSSQVSGRVVDLSPMFLAGGFFKKGDVLITLEQGDYITDVKSAEAELARANAALEEEQARGKVAEEEWRSVKGTTAPELGLRKPQLAQEIANVRAAEANLERAQRNLDRTLIKAPYDGLVRSKNVDLGQFVSVGSNLGLIFGTDIAEIRLPLSDNDLAFLELQDIGKDGQVSEVLLNAKVAGKEQLWKGQLARSEGVLDENNRVAYAVVQVSDPYQREQNHAEIPLKFGRFVQADITGQRAEGLAVLPKSVLRLDGTVIVVDSERKLRVQAVNVVRTDREFIYINEGLNEHEWVTETVIPNPETGMLVRISLDEDSAQSSGKLAPVGE